MTGKLAGVLRDPQPKTAQQAMASLQAPLDLRSYPIRNRIDTVSYDGLCPPMIVFMRRLKAEMERYAIPMAFMEGWRTPGRQAELKAQGVSQAGPGSSPHQYGLAFDYVHAVRGWKLSPAEWSQIGAIGKEVARKLDMPIEWGGDWRFYDPAHWQVQGWRSLKSVMDALDLDESNRPDAGAWSKIIQAGKPALARVR